MSLLRCLFMGAALLLAGCSKAPEAPPVQPGGSRVALWEVSDKTGPRAWIFGTVHALPKGTAWQRPEIAAALGKSDRLVLEIAEQLDPQIAGAALARLAVTRGLPPVSARVGPAHRGQLEQTFQSLGLRDETFTDQETWAVALQIAAIKGEAGGIHAADGVEPELRRLAGTKRVEGLEDIDSQFAMFDQMAQPQQTRLLDETLAEIASPEDEERDLLKLWLSGDELGIARESAKGFLADGALRDVLLTRRNQAWSTKLDAMLKQGARPFIAVGAAHVAGDAGLPALLAARGWTVKRVP